MFLISHLLWPRFTALLGRRSVRKYSVFTTTQPKAAASQTTTDISNTGSIDPQHLHAEFQRIPRTANPQTLLLIVR
jgi:hypothetical protein